MVQLDDRHVRGQERDRLEDLRAERGVPLDGLELLVVQLGRLGQDRVADADLADVVQQRAQAQHVQILLAEPHGWPIATDSRLTRSEWPAV